MVFSWNIMVGWRFPQHPFDKNVLASGHCAMKINCHPERVCGVAMITADRCLPCDDYLSGSRNLFGDVLFGFFCFFWDCFWINGFFGGFWVAKKSMDWFKGPWREWKRCVFLAKKCYGLPVNFHSSSLVLWLMFFCYWFMFIYAIINKSYPSHN